MPPSTFFLKQSLMKPALHHRLNSPSMSLSYEVVQNLTNEKQERPIREIFKKPQFFQLISDLKWFQSIQSILFRTSFIVTNMNLAMELVGRPTIVFHLAKARKLVSSHF